LAGCRPLFQKKQKGKKKKKEEEMDHSFFSFRLKLAFIGLHHRLSLPAARQSLVSSGNIRQSSPPTSVFHLDFEGGLFILNIILLIYIS
jgi:hypothetical protein